MSSYLPLDVVEKPRRVETAVDLNKDDEFFVLNALISLFAFRFWFAAAAPALLCAEIITLSAVVTGPDASRISGQCLIWDKLSMMAECLDILDNSRSLLDIIVFQSEIGSECLTTNKD